MHRGNGNETFYSLKSITLITYFNSLHLFFFLKKKHSLLLFFNESKHSGILSV